MIKKNLWVFHFSSYIIRNHLRISYFCFFFYKAAVFKAWITACSIQEQVILLIWCALDHVLIVLKDKHMSLVLNTIQNQINSNDISPDFRDIINLTLLQTINLNGTWICYILNSLCFPSGNNYLLWYFIWIVNVINQIIATVLGT